MQVEYKQTISLQTHNNDNFTVFRHYIRKLIHPHGNLKKKTS
jgi:hypothetical protein